MKCIATNVNNNWDESIFKDAEIDFSITIRDEIKKFIQVNAGGYPVKDLIYADGDEYEIRVFLSADKMDANYCIQKPLNYFLTKTKGKIIPIGIDSGDNYYCVNNETGKVYYWSASEDMYFCIASDIAGFIELFAD